MSLQSLLEGSSSKDRRVGIYSRVSTFDQDPDCQLFQLRDYAVKHDLNVLHEYVDYVTGSFEKRIAKGIKAKAFEELMSDVRSGKINCILCWRYDRVARSLYGLMTVFQELIQLKVDLIVSTQNFDTTTATGKLFLHILASFSQFERDQLIERVKIGLEKARLKGIHLGRPIKNPAACEEVIALHKAGLSLRKIAPIVSYSPSGVFKIIKRFRASGSASSA